MAEFKLGRIRFVWQGAWTTGQTYAIDDVISKGGKSYICVVNHVASAHFATDLQAIPTKWNVVADGTTWRGDWEPNEEYDAGDQVKYGGIVYICDAPHSSAGLTPTTVSATGLSLNAGKATVTFATVTPSPFPVGSKITISGMDPAAYNGEHTVTASTTSSVTFATPFTAPYVSGGDVYTFGGLEASQDLWTPFAEAFNYRGSWSTGTRYALNDFVSYGGFVYICAVPHVSAATVSNGLEADQNKWEIFNQGIIYLGNWSGSSVRYKINDVVKYGAGTWICTTHHTSSATFDITKWSQFTEGFEFENSWNSTTTYQIGDTVTYGGYSYIAKTNNINKQPTTNPSDWDVFTTGFNFRSEWDVATAYKVGDAVRLHGYTYVASADNTGEEPPNASYWSRLNSGFFWTNNPQTYTGLTGTNVSGVGVGAQFDVVRSGTVYSVSLVAGQEGTGYAATNVIKILGSALGGITPANDLLITVTAINVGGSIDTFTWSGRSATWNSGTVYVLGDVVLFGGNSYVCVVAHTAATGNRPDNDITASYWNVLTIGSEVNVLTTTGDMIYYGANGPTRLPVGVDGQILRSTDGFPAWANYGLINNLVYVGPLGRDEPAPASGLTIDKPWKTVRYACKQIEEGYLNPQAKHLLQKNKQFILKEVDNYLYYTCQTTITSHDNGTYEFTCNSTAGLNVNMPIVFSGTALGGITLGTVYYVKTIVSNTAFTISNTFGGVVRALTGSATGTMTGRLDYDRTKTERDTGIIYDAIIYDLTRGGTNKSVAAGRAYFTTAGNAFINATTRYRITNFVQAHVYLKTLLGNVLSNTAPSNNYQSLNGISLANRAQQIIDGAFTAETTALAQLSGLVDLIDAALNQGSATALPTSTKPNTTIMIKTGTYNEILPIYVPEFTALVGDELRTSVVQPAAPISILASDKSKTISAINHVKSLLPDIISNTSVTPTLGNDEDQITTLPMGSAGSSAAAAAIEKSTQVVYDILASGLTAIPTLVMPDPTNYNTTLVHTAYATTGNATGNTLSYGDARAQVLQNYAFIKAEISAWLADPTNGYDTIWNGFTAAQKASCLEDIGFILDAVRHDVTYGGNRQSLIAGSAYFSNNILVIPLATKPAELAGLTRLKVIVGQIANKLSVTVSPGNTETQVTTGTVGLGGPFAGTFMQDRIQNVIDYINNGVAPASISPCYSWTSPSLQTAFDALTNTKAEIQSDATAWIKKFYQEVSFDTALSTRDAGLIVDAISYDMLLGTNFNSIKAGMAYYRPTTSAEYVISAQKDACLGAIHFIKYKAAAIATTGATAQAQKILTDVTKYIKGGAVVDFAWPNPSNINSGFAAAETLINDNKEFIKSEIIAYLGSAYPSLVYSPAKCSEDVGYIVDALVYDLKYGGTYASKMAGKAYYSFGTLQVYSSEKTATLAAYTYLKALVQAIAVDSTTVTGYASSPYQATVSQTRKDVLQTNGSAGAATQLGVLVDIITNIIDLGDTTGVPTVTITTIAGGTTLTTGSAHGLKVGDTIVPQTSGNGLVAGSTYYVVSTPLTTTLTISNSFSGTPITTLTNGTLLTIAAEKTIVPTFSQVSSTATNAFITLNGTLTTIKGSISSFITTNYPTLVYNSATCLRDIGYVVDSIGYDFMLGSNFQTVKAAMSYYRAQASKVVGEQKRATVATFRYLRTLISTSLINYPTQKAQARSLMAAFIKIVDQGISDVVETYGTVTYNNTLSIIKGAEILRANADFLAAEASAYVTESYGGSVSSIGISSIVTTVPHNLSVNDPVVFTGVSDGGVSISTTYYVVNTPSNVAFNVSTTLGGTPITLSVASTPTLTVRYKFDATLCQRDMKEFVLALVYDLQWTGNYKSLRAARLYKNAVEGSALSDMFYVRNACGVRNMTVNGLNGDLTEENDYGTKRPTAGAYTSLDPGFGPNDSAAWVLERSCYCQNVSLFGTGCTGMKIDGAIHAGGNRSIVANDYTTILSDGIGVWCTGAQSLTELVSVFCYYSYSGYLAELGGRMRATNGNSSYGVYGVIAEGTDSTEIPLYANLDNRSAGAVVQNVVTDGINKVLRFEYLNAGQSYTNVDVAVSGSGFNVVAVGDEFRDDAVYETRLIDKNDGNGYGGQNYGTAINAAQGGDLANITISATDTALSTAYVGMRVHITAGSGVGQYANILDYSNGSKVAKVYKDSFTPLTITNTTVTTNVITVASTGTLYVNQQIYLGGAIGGLTANTLYYVTAISSATQFTVSTSQGGSSPTLSTATGSVALYEAGWDHVVPGTPLVTPLDLTTTYVIEPRINYTAPGYTATARTLSATTTWGSVTYANNRFIALATGGTATSYSTNGTTWAAGGTLPSSGAWIHPVYGGGSGATATATVGGLGGTGAVLVANLGAANSTGAAAGDQVASITVVNGGFGYTSPPTIVFTSATGSNAVGVAKVLNGSITSVSVESADGGSYGSGYLTAPTVAAVTDRVTYVTVNTYGRNYLVPPTVTFSGGGATSQATATAVLTTSTNGVYQINITDGGSGYTSVPTVTITDTTAAYVTMIPGTTNTAYLLSSSAVGANWTAGGALPAGTFADTAYGGGIYVAVGGTASAASTGSIVSNWVSRTIPTLGSGTYSAVEYGGVTFVAISTGNTATAISTNGSSWTAGGALPASTTWNSIAYGNGRFVALAATGRVAYSLDFGTTWYAVNTATGTTTSVLSSSLTWSRISYGQGLFFAIASGTNICATSPDGITWTVRAMPSSSAWSGIAFGNPSKNPIWVAVSSTSGQIAASMRTGAQALGRIRAQSGIIQEIRMSEPGSGYPYGTITATTATTNLITADNTINLVDSQPVEFVGLDSYGLTSDVTYYVIGSTITSTQFKVSATPGSATAIILTTGTGLSGSYKAAPIQTIIDPNDTVAAPIRARMGDGVLGNPTFTNRGSLNTTATALLTGDGRADFYQASNFIAVTNLFEIPKAGSNVAFASIPGEYYKLVTISNILSMAPTGDGNYTAVFQISPALTVYNAPGYLNRMTMTIKYSQVRLTGHDFLYIGTGNQARTNYPYVDPSLADINKQTLATNGGRVFFTSTDQDGNFNVGNLFGVQQATGTATLNANAFNLSGLQSLQLSGLSLGVGSATITQFSTDPYFTANSDNILPTQRAIKSYITAQIGGGLSQLNVNTLTAGVVYIANNTISTTSGGQLNVTAKMNFTGGIDGAPVALGFFLSR